MLFERRLARAERLCPPPPVAPPSAATVWRQAVTALVLSMPPEYGRIVVDELGSEAAPGPLTERGLSLARARTYQATHPDMPASRAPLTVPAEICRLLTELPPGAVQFSIYGCVGCGLAMPFPVWKDGHAIAPAPPGQVSYLSTCPHCGSAQFAWFTGLSESALRG